MILAKKILTACGPNPDVTEVGGRESFKKY